MSTIIIARRVFLNVEKVPLIYLRSRVPAGKIKAL